MKKTITMFFIIMTFLSMAISIKYNNEVERIIGSVIILMVLCILQIINSLNRKNEKIILVFQSLIIGISLIFKNYDIIYIFPIIVFDLLNKKNILYSIITSTVIILILKRADYLNLFIYIVLLNLYLFEVKKNHIRYSRLKEFNRDEREEKFKIKEKLSNLEKYLEQNTIMTTLKERNFMAQKLHDHLGHRITSSLMQLEVVKETLIIDQVTSKSYLIKAMENLREGMEEIRVLLKAVKPQEKVISLEDIKEKLLEFQYSSRIKTVLKTEGDLEKIKLNIWLVIEENLKESLTNVGKHSKANVVTLSILVYNKILRVEIRDDGVGSDFKNLGLGIKGINERVEAINGRLECFNDNGFVMNMIFKLGENDGY